MTTAATSIDYDAFTQDALRGVVRAVLELVVRSGLHGEHHFYIAFNTQAPGVVLSRRLKEKYPEEMMIVLQHRFWDLAVSEDGFEVKLTFDGIPERLCVPFQALRVFHDPSVRFTLQFGQQSEGEAQEAGGRRRRDNAEQQGRRGKNRPRTRGDGAETNEPLVEEAVAKGKSPQGQPSPVPGQGPQSQPAVFTPRAVEPARAVPTPSEPQEAAAAADAQGRPAGQAGGAKVLSLDQFRKK